MRGRLRITGGLLAAFAALAPAAPAQDRLSAGPDVRYWPLREINFPVPLDKIAAADPRPTKLRFYAAPDRGRFKMVDERGVKDLDVIDAVKGSKGFRYTSPADGEYDFALQFVFADGDTQPRTDALQAQFRVVFDTRPPAIRFAAVGSSGVEWDVQDENHDADGVRLEVRWQGSSQWVARTPRAFSLRDRYTWQGLTAGQPLEVRIVVKDKAGQETASRVVTLPTSNAPGLSTGGGGDPYRAPVGGLDDFPNRPTIDYVNTRSLSVESRLTRVTRSGVKTAHLWVNDGKGGWRKADAKDVNIGPNAADPSVRIPYAATKDGLYGFIVIPENGAGGKQDDPRPNDPAQLLVEVDTEKPFVKIKGVRVSPGGLVGPRVEIEWDALDKNLMPDPIVLEYSEDRTEWKKIAEKVPNTGRYVWEVDDKNLWKFYVRARAVDKASNTGENVYDKEVMIDLEKPSAEIHKVHGGPGVGGSSMVPDRREFDRQAVTPSGMTVKPNPIPAPVSPPPMISPAPPSRLSPPDPAPVPLAPGGTLPVPALPNFGG